jgi:hypothetical protein
MKSVRETLRAKKMGENPQETGEIQPAASFSPGFTAFFRVIGGLWGEKVSRQGAKTQREDGKTRD